jgi:hypothetical protein
MGPRSRTGPRSAPPKGTRSARRPSFPLGAPDGRTMGQTVPAPMAHHVPLRLFWRRITPGRSCRDQRSGRTPTHTPLLHHGGAARFVCASGANPLPTEAGPGVLLLRARSMGCTASRGPHSRRCDWKWWQPEEEHTPTLRAMPPCSGRGGRYPLERGFDPSLPSRGEPAKPGGVSRSRVAALCHHFLLHPTPNGARNAACGCPRPAFRRESERT